MTAMAVDGDGASAARRRRERRLRSWWRHEQQSVAMALSAAAHHSFDKVAAEAKYSGPRAQKTDRAEAAYQAPRRPTTRAAREPELFQLHEEELGGVRPPPLSEVRPQDGVMRHAVRDYEHNAPMVQVLDVPVPQPVEIQQRTVNDMLMDMTDRVQQRIAALEEMESVPRPLPPDRTQQRAVEQWEFQYSLWLMGMRCMTALNSELWSSFSSSSAPLTLWTFLFRLWWTPLSTA